MHPNEYKNKIVIVFSLAVLLVVYATILLYNAIPNAKDTVGILPVILFLLALLFFGFSLIFVLKAISDSNIQEIIEENINKERTKIFKELEKENEEEEEEEKDQNIEDVIKNIVPKGNYKNIETFSAKLLKKLADNLNLVQGIFYLKDSKINEFTYISGYALTNENNIPNFKSGENLPGQVAETREISYISDIPEEYFEIESGLGKAKPKELIFVPLVLENEVLAVLELASFSNFNDLEKKVLEGVLKSISTKVSQTIKS